MRSSVRPLRAAASVRALFLALVLLTALAAWPGLLRAQTLPDFTELVERVGPAFGEDAVALRVGVGAMGSTRASRVSVNALADRIGCRAKMVSTRASKPTREGACAPHSICCRAH